LSSLNGLFLINKPSGCTSHDLVAQARKVLKTKDIGHCGTLDPMAQGLMVLAVGEGLKLVSSVTLGDKSYHGQIQFGLSTDTLDITGQVLTRGSLPSSESLIVEAAQTLMGSFDCPVPRYSAVKVQGEKLYEKARQGEEFTPPTRLMSFYDFKAGIFDGQKWDFSFSCSKGSFVRSWVELLCQKLEVPGTLSQLQRTGSAPYLLSQAITLENLQEQVSSQSFSEIQKQCYFVSLSQALHDWTHVRAYGYDLHLLRNGQISKSLKAQFIRLYQASSFKGYKVFSENTDQLVALVGLEPGRGFFIRRGFR
jgi:tRNA pseudouridine55 synthase